MANMPVMKTALTLILAPLMALSFAVPGAWSQAMPLEEVPFVTTPDNVTLEMLGTAGVNANDYVLDMGSGDGRIVITAALNLRRTRPVTLLSLDDVPTVPVLDERERLWSDAPLLIVSMTCVILVAITVVIRVPDVQSHPDLRS